jgi:predicted transcriptional regulator
MHATERSVLPDELLTGCVESTQAALQRSDPLAARPMSITGWTPASGPAVLSPSKAMRSGNSLGRVRTPNQAAPRDGTDRRPLGDLPPTERGCDKIMSMSTLTPKEQARALIDQLPDSATWDDVAQAIAVEEGLADLRAGRVVEGDAVMRWLESWGTEHELAPPRA